MKLTILSLSCANYHDIWGLQPPGNLMASPDLYGDCCTFTFTIPPLSTRLCVLAPKKPDREVLFVCFFNPYRTNVENRVSS